jgi:predicted kinase/diadenosine tetraphosphate (Ap4A) HIT family hydrolase
VSDARTAPLLVALRGLPGVGKTTLARALSRELGWTVLDKDDLEAGLHGRTNSANHLAYDLLFRLAGRQLQHGLSVICDSPLRHPSLYALAVATADEAAARLVVLDCILSDEAELRRCIHARASGDTAPWTINAWSALEEYRAHTSVNAEFEINVPRHVADLGRPEQEVATEAATWLRDRANPAPAWMPRGRWDALVRGEDCPVCTEVASEGADNREGYFVTDLRVSRLRLSREQHVPGWCVLLSRRHVREPHELSEAERIAFFDDMVRVGDALERVYGALKINYQILGNAVPHLHAHVHPRFYGDPYPGRPVSGPPRHAVYLSASTYRQQIQRIRAALA